MSANSRGTTYVAIRTHPPLFSVTPSEFKGVSANSFHRSVKLLRNNIGNHDKKSILSDVTQKLWKQENFQETSYFSG